MQGGFHLVIEQINLDDATHSVKWSNNSAKSTNCFQLFPI
jgi:hypothetical protein